MTDNRVPVIHCPAYTVFYERTAECVVVHVDMRRWSAQVKRRFVADINTAQHLLGDAVYARWEGTAHHNKFLLSMGFVPVGTAKDLATGEDVRMYCRPYPGMPMLLWN